MNKDELIKGLLYEQSIMLTAIDGTRMVKEARATHDLWPVCTAALGRTLLMTAMMSCQLKHEDESLSAIIKGNGPTGSIVTTGRDSARVKGYIHNPHVDLPLKAAGKLDVGGAVGKDGTLTVVKDLGLKEPHTGQSALVSGEIAEDFAHFFLTSDNMPTLVYLGVLLDGDGEVRAAGGLWLQPMPFCSEKLLDELQLRAREFGFLTRMLDGGQTLGAALAQFFGDALTVIERLEPRYQCDCSRKRLERVVISMGQAEIEDIIREDKGAELICHFCNTKYMFTTEELKHLLELAK